MIPPSPHVKNMRTVYTMPTAMLPSTIRCTPAQPRKSHETSTFSFAIGEVGLCRRARRLEFIGRSMNRPPSLRRAALSLHRDLPDDVVDVRTTAALPRNDDPMREDIDGRALQIGRGDMISPFEHR